MWIVEKAENKLNMQNSVCMYYHIAIRNAVWTTRSSLYNYSTSTKCVNVDCVDTLCIDIKCTFGYYSEFIDYGPYYSMY